MVVKRKALICLTTQPSFLSQHPATCPLSAHASLSEKDCFYSHEPETETERGRDRGQSREMILVSQTVERPPLPTCTEEISSSAEKPTWQTLMPHNSKAGHKVFPLYRDRLCIYTNTVRLAYVMLPFNICPPTQPPLICPIYWLIWNQL